LTFFVFLVQTAGPWLIFVNNWEGDTNYLRNLGELGNRLTLAEAFCLGPDRTSQCTTILGTLFMVITILSIRNDISNEVEDVEKTKRMPGHWFYYWLGNTANLLCGIGTTLAVLLLFWGEDMPLGLVLDSMGLLFIQKLDDLSDIVFCYMGSGDADFQRQCAWSSILLAQCPVEIRDILNPEAKTVDDLWVIRFDASGRLLNAKGELCKTRLCRAPPDETTMLEAAPEAATSAMEGELIYNRQLTSWRIPTTSGYLWHHIWHAANWLLIVLQFIQPVLFYIVNDPCEHPVPRKAD
jgi:hypothetical protein